jgi:hypothetical protein
MPPSFSSWAQTWPDAEQSEAVIQADGSELPLQIAEVPKQEQVSPDGHPLELAPELPPDAFPPDPMPEEPFDAAEEPPEETLPEKPPPDDPLPEDPPLEDRIPDEPLWEEPPLTGPLLDEPLDPGENPPSRADPELPPQEAHAKAISSATRLPTEHVCAGVSGRLPRGITRHSFGF